jgi:hypothetical protein
MVLKRVGQPQGGCWDSWGDGEGRRRLGTSETIGKTAAVLLVWPPACILVVYRLSVSVRLNTAEELSYIEPASLIPSPH